MWAVVAVASAVNYRHGSAGWQQPGLTGIVFATLSVGSVAGWELRERQAYWTQIDDRLPARRPRFGYARRIRFPLTTAQALSVAIRDGLTVRSLTLMRGLLYNDLLHGPTRFGTPLAPATSCTPGRGQRSCRATRELNATASGVGRRSSATSTFPTTTSTMTTLVPE
jgi:hypothetical protein